MNLITEYRKRHRDDFIPLCHDGVCFFDLNKKPNLIALTSSACRSFQTCGDCENNKDPNIIVEFFQALGNSFMVIGHHHVEPAADLTQLMRKKLGCEEYRPYFAPTPRHLETWLWRFCANSSRFRLKSAETDPQLKIVEQMVYAAQKQPKVYQAYYFAHETFLLQRKYLLFGEEK